MFADAKTLNEKTTTKKSKKKLVEVEGLYEFTLLDTAIKNLTSLKKSVEAGVKSVAAEIFLEEAKEVNGRPENFRGWEKDAEASVECRKRSLRSTLSPSEVKTLEGAGVPYDTVDDVADTYVINPEYATDMTLLLKVEKALSGVKGLPSDLIMKQEGTSRKVVSDETIEAVFADENLRDELFDTVTTLALKAKLTKGDISDALSYLSETLS